MCKSYSAKITGKIKFHAAEIFLSSVTLTYRITPEHTNVLQATEGKYLIVRDSESTDLVNEL